MLYIIYIITNQKQKPFLLKHSGSSLLRSLITLTKLTFIISKAIPRNQDLL
jgi:hypothetical protein